MIGIQFVFKKDSAVTKKVFSDLEDDVKVLRNEIIQLRNDAVLVKQSMELINGIDKLMGQLKDENTLLKQELMLVKSKAYRLESQVIRHQLQLDTLLKENPKIKTEAQMNSNSTDENDNLLKNNVSERFYSGFPRTCQDVFDGNPSTPSGHYWIDPDGQNAGDNPIYVECVMTIGK